MVGGGEGSFIGAIHRMAAQMDGEIELVAGAFSSNAARAKVTGEKLGIASQRNYSSYREMIQQEYLLPEDERIHFVSIVTPNFLHYPVASEALKAGFHVLSDKPAAGTLEETKLLRKAVVDRELLFGLTQTYTAYPMIRQAKAMIAAGELGEIRRVSASYTQGWLSSAEDNESSAQAEWRLDPKRGGESGCFADIATHVHNLVEYVTGQKMASVCADITTLVKDRLLDDDGAALFKLESGARGTLTASQVCTGEGNNLNIAVFGDNASLFWQHEDPNKLFVKRRNGPEQIYRAGSDCDYLSPEALKNCRTPAGHPEGYIEAFANIYRAFANAVRGNHKAIDPGIVADINAGVRSMAFVRAALESSRGHSQWLSLDSYLD